MEGVKSLVILGHPGLCWRRQIPYRGRTPRFNSNLCRGRGRGAHYCWHHWRGHQGCRSRGQKMQGSRCDRRAGVSEPRLAAVWLSEGLHRIFTRQSGKNQAPSASCSSTQTRRSFLRSRYTARDRDPARCRRHQERRDVEDCAGYKVEAFLVRSRPSIPAITRDHKVRVEGRQADHRSNPVILPIAILRHI